jgi:hypothetical protein
MRIELISLDSQTNVLTVTPTSPYVDKTGIEPIRTDFQSAALPFELLVHFVGTKGFKPSTFPFVAGYSFI